MLEHSIREKKLRQYSISSNEDCEQINNGRCPSYALNWENENNDYWPADHDYFIGNGITTNEPETQLRKILSDKKARGTLHYPLIFCDLDGVLCDFEYSIKKEFGKQSSEIHPSTMWEYIHNTSSFFEELEWMPKGRQLWESIMPYDPIILTGVPHKNKNIIEQKVKWCKNELGHTIHVITCLSSEKPNYCLRQSILIDDRQNYETEWRKKGGKFLHYKEENQEQILNKLNSYIYLNGLASP